MRPRVNGKMSCKYTIHKDLVDRLSGCFFLYGNELVYIGDVTNKNKLVIYRPDDMNFKIKEINPDDPDLDISSLELGYFNFEHHQLGPKVVYMVRHPYKRWKQGVNQNNTQILGIDGEQIHQGGYRCPNGNHLHFSTGFRDSIEGRFPKLEEVLSKTGEYAVSQDIAVRSTRAGVHLVYYKTREVGWIAPSSKTINIPNNYISDIILDQLKSDEWSLSVCQ